MDPRNADSDRVPEPAGVRGAANGAGIPKEVILVVHGPEIFDTGGAAWLIATLAPVRTIVAGVMARTAAEESGLPVEFNGAPPSRIIQSISGPAALANHAKTAESGIIFGDIIASRLDGQGLIQIECSSKTVLAWDAADRELALRISDLTGYSIAFLSSGTCGSRDDERRIRGCLPGEQVYVNGIIVGQAMEDTIVLRDMGSSIEAVSGLAPKEHGLEKLGRIGRPDLASAWCKSGPIRLAKPGCRSQGAPASGSISVIDHCGHTIYDTIGPDCCGVLSIGDDTTAVCGHICVHRGIPVLGIVDGDRDTCLPSAFAPGSVILLALDERDDDLGREVAGMTGDGPVTWAGWVASVLARLGSRVRIIFDTREDRHDAVR